MIATAATDNADALSSVHLLPRLETSCDVAEHLVEIIIDSAKPAQQRLSEAVAFAATCGWETCAIFALAPDLIREVQLQCDKDRHEKLLLTIIDGEDGNERLQVCYTTPRICWERII